MIFVNFDVQGHLNFRIDMQTCKFERLPLLLSNNCSLRKILDDLKYKVYFYTSQATGLYKKKRKMVQKLNGSKIKKVTK